MTIRGIPSSSSLSMPALESVTSSSSIDSSSNNNNNNNSNNNNSNNKTKIRKYIDGSPTKLDVLCGRGNVYASKPGNVAFQQLILRNMDAYSLASGRPDKVKVVESVMKQILSTGSRIVKFDAVVNKWYEIPRSEAHQKCGHCLRDSIRSRQRKTTKALREHELERYEEDLKATTNHLIGNEGRKRHSLEAIKKKKTKKNISKKPQHQQEQQRELPPLMTPLSPVRSSGPIGCPPTLLYHPQQPKQPAVISPVPPTKTLSSVAAAAAGCATTAQSIDDFVARFCDENFPTTTNTSAAATRKNSGSRNYVSDSSVDSSGADDLDECIVDTLLLTDDNCEEKATDPLPLFPPPLTQSSSSTPSSLGHRHRHHHHHHHHHHRQTSAIRCFEDEFPELNMEFSMTSFFAQ